MDSIQIHFQQCDEVLFNVLSSIPLVPPQKSKEPFLSLIDSIISQQLSVKASDTILKRFITLFDGQDITPEKIVVIPHETLRGVGMSNSKAQYVRNIAQAVVDGSLRFDTFHVMTDEEIITEMVKIKGIGRWTAEMFLIFALGRPDVFSVGDLGLRRAVQKLYGFKNEPSVKTLQRISKKWSPYRSYASRLLWKSLEL